MLLESVYSAMLAYELGRRSLRTVRQRPIPVIYDQLRMDTGFRADLMVKDKSFVEIKSVELLLPVQKKQLLTCRRLADKRLGLSYQLRRPDQGRHRARGEWPARRVSCQAAKIAKSLASS